MTVLLAVSSALLVGGADFIGGVLSRAASAVRVAALAQLAGLVVAVPAALVVDAERVTRADAIWSVASGAAVGLGLVLFYTAMARGLISLVAPVTAVVGALVPVAYAIGGGERPGALALVGIALRRRPALLGDVAVLRTIGAPAPRCSGAPAEDRTP